MTDRAALLAAITGAGLTDPDAIRAARADDMPRLAYADLIQDEGESVRAEFIRVQVELARNGGSRDYSDWRDRIEPLRLRERKLWRHVWRWVPTHLEKASWYLSSTTCETIHGEEGQPNRCVLHWSRGFVSRLTCSWDDWRDHHERITAEHPVEEVTLTTWPNHGPLTEDEVRDDLKMRWPTITFHLPPAPPDIPLDGWRIELDQTDHGTMMGYPVIMRSRLWREWDQLPVVLGQVFGSVVATDNEGRRWTCHVLLTEIDGNRLSAVSVGEVRRVVVDMDWNWDGTESRALRAPREPFQPSPGM